MPLSMCCSECQTIQCAEGSSTDSSASAESSSFVFLCAKSRSFFNLQACLPVQCNAVPTLCMCSSSTTMPETTSSEILRKRKTNSFSVMVPSWPGPTWLRGLGTCPQWTGLNLSASQERIASYILFGIFLHQDIVFNCFTFSFSLLSKAICGSLAALCDTTRFWALPVFTHIVVHSLGRMVAQMLTSFFTCLRTVRVLFLGDVSELCTLGSLVRFIT